MEEILFRMLEQKIHSGAVVPFCHPRGAPIFSHLLYADDIVIFANGSKTTIKNIAKILNQYGEWSGQEVNKRKSSIFFSKRFPQSRRRILLRTIDFSEGGFPFNYLGVPIISGRLLVTHFEGLINRVRSRIKGWKARLLSNGSRILLVKHVLQSIPIHCLSILHTPKVVLAKLKNLLSTFFWGVKDGKPKKKWKKWDDLCKPIAEGGIGIRNLHEFQYSLH